MPALQATPINKNLLGLRFVDQVTEAQFVAEYDLENSHSNRTGVILSYIGWALIVLYSLLFAQDSLLIVLVIVAGLYAYFTVQLVMMSRQQYAKYYQASCVVGNGAAGLASIVITVGMFHDAFAGSVFLLGMETFAFFTLRMRHRLAVYTVVSYTIAGQAFVLVAGHFDLKSLVTLSFSLWMFFFVLCIAGFELELAARTAFSERRAKDSLLRNILPEKVAAEIAASGFSRPVRVDSATILFSDFVHFTEATKGIDPVSIVGLLNRYFTCFDAIMEQHSLERLKTIGDGYMSAGGIPTPNRTHPVDVCMAALAMLRFVRETQIPQDGTAFSIRIGINSGPVIAGIIGKAKFSYDIWGEAVNIASRHETSAVEGSINVSRSTYLLTRNFFDFRPRGLIDIKGGDRLEMYELFGVQQKYIAEGDVNDAFRETYRRLATGELMLGFDI
jgi:class 3 adenylate cyclase